jgi:UDP-2,3-diacylglucosamine hydrolase
MRIAHLSSRKSRNSLGEREFKWNGEENEWLVQYCYRKMNQGIVPDYFIFGHRHLAVDWQLQGAKSRYINLGDWMSYFTWAEYNGSDLTYHFLENNDKKLISNHLPIGQRVVRFEK